MSTLSDLRPPKLQAVLDDDPSDVDTPSGVAADRTMPNRGAPPASLLQLPIRKLTFQPADHAGDLGRLGRYRILKELGRGGMGAVYLGFDERLQRKVALKVMRPEFAHDAEAKERFLREARAAGRIAHDNVIAVHEADEAGGIPFIAMQYLQGYSLDQYLAKKGRPSFPQIVRIGREVALGLAAAHKFGIVHRDIKPANVWLEAPHGRVKILDFGLARPARGGAEGEITQSGAVVGTPAYMSPEQGRGEKLDHRADLFSLGVLLYRLITNRLPFDGPDVMAILTALAVDDPKPIWELNPAVPKPLAQLIHELMAKKPAQRPQTADEVSARLYAMMDRPATATAAPNQVVYVPISVTMLGAADNAFADIVEGETLAREEPKVRGPQVRGKWPVRLLLAGGLAMVLGGGIIVKIVNKDGTTTEVKLPDGAKVVVEKDGKKLLDTGGKPAEAKKEPPAREAADVGPFPKLDPAWLKTVAALPRTDALGPLNEELKRRNPGYDGTGLSWGTDPIIGTKTALELRSGFVVDLTPLLVFPDLESLLVANEGKEEAPLTNLAPLRGLKKLRSLHLHRHFELKDLSPLRDLPLEHLTVRTCPVESLAPLQNLKLEKLVIGEAPVTDFAPLAKMPLRELEFGHAGKLVDLSPLAGTPLERVTIVWGIGMDLAPLKKCPLKSFTMSYVSQPDLSPLEGSGIERFSGFDPVQFEPFLRTLPKLESVTSYTSSKPMTKEAYFERCEKYRKDNEAFVTATRKLPLDERVTAVKRWYMQANPGRKATLDVTVEAGEVVGVSFAGSDAGNDVWNLSFLRCFPKLRKIDLSPFYYSPLFHQILDLPVEEIRVTALGMCVGNNLYVLPKMKALKTINEAAVADLAIEWNFKLAAK